MMSTSNGTIWLALMMGLVVGVGGSVMFVTPEMALPDRTLILHVQNQSGDVLPSVEIHYANVDTQQNTTLLQLAAGETRSVVLNHEPGLGYNIEARYPDGRVTSICGGRHPESREMRETITTDSILSGIGKP